jgi:hypothetical protein
LKAPHGALFFAHRAGQRHFLPRRGEPDFPRRPQGACRCLMNFRYKRRGGNMPDILETPGIIPMSRKFA